MVQWEPMVNVIPPGKCGDCEITHFEVSQQASEFTQIRAMVNGCDEYVPPGKYCHLSVRGVLMMTDTMFEKNSNVGAVHAANGDVLIAGLGMGMILIPILRKPEVKSVLVVEQNSNVVDLVLGPLTVVLKPEEVSKLTVVTADIFEWKPDKTAHWDTIYFDIWANWGGDNLLEMTRLKRRFARRLNRANPRAWMGCWQERVLRQRNRQNARLPSWR